MTRPGDNVMADDGTPCVVVPVKDYARLLEAAESDDMIVRCEVCSAWLDADDEACAHIDDFTGCWKAATKENAHAHLCRSWRALDVPVSAAIRKAANPTAGEA